MLQLVSLARRQRIGLRFKLPPVYLHTVLKTKQRCYEYQFLVYGLTRPEIEAEFTVFTVVL